MSPPAEAYDSPQSSPPAAGCGPDGERCAEVITLHIKVDKIENTLHSIVQQHGEMLGALGEAAKHSRISAEKSIESARDAKAARAAAERTDRKFYASANETLSKHQYDSDRPLLDALDYGNKAGEVTKNQSLAEIVDRSHTAESKARKLEKERQMVEAEVKRQQERAELHRLQAEEAHRRAQQIELEKQRVDAENKLKLERAVLINKLLAAAAALALAIAGGIGLLMKMH